MSPTITREMYIFKYAKMINITEPNSKHRYTGTRIVDIVHF